MLPIIKLFPDATRLLAFNPEDLALVLIEYFKLLPSQDRWLVSRCVRHWTIGYPPEVRDDVANLLLASWSWLHEHGYFDRRNEHDRRAAGGRADGDAA